MKEQCALSSPIAYHSALLMMMGVRSSVVVDMCRISQESVVALYQELSEYDWEAASQVSHPTETYDFVLPFGRRSDVNSIA